ncbi:MAG: hypothetical protein ABWX96_13815, partial [Propionibacteriaceae bacterium]
MVTFDWNSSALTLRFLALDDGPVCLVDIGTAAAPLAPADPSSYHRVHQPLVEVLTPQLGNDNSSNSGRHSSTRLGTALRYVRHTT